MCQVEFAVLCYQRVTISQVKHQMFYTRENRESKCITLYITILRPMQLRLVFFWSLYQEVQVAFHKHKTCDTCIWKRFTDKC